MAFYGFTDKRVAQNLKRIGLNGVHTPSSKIDRSTPIDNGSRIYLVQPSETIPAATITDGTLIPGSGTVTIYEIIDTIVNNEPAYTTQARTNGESTALTAIAYNTGFNSLESSSSLLHIAVEDSFGRLVIVHSKATAECVLCKVHSGTTENGFEVSIYANGKQNPATGFGTLHVPELALGATIPEGSWIIGHPCVIAETGGNEI